MLKYTSSEKRKNLYKTLFGSKISFCEPLEAAMNILLIDNEESLLDLMEGLIRFSVDISDLNFKKARKPDEANRLALQNGPECVVIDPHFSEEWGLPLIKTIKEFKPKTFLIAFSNCSEQRVGNNV